MRKISSTRTALLTRKEQIKLARQGHELLEQKRRALMEELVRVADVVRILAQVCVVGSNIEADRQRLGGMDAGARDIEQEQVFCLYNS